MSRSTVLILLGIFIAIVPFSGFPISWLSFFLPAAGGIIVVIGIGVRTAPRREVVQEFIVNVPNENTQ